MKDYYIQGEGATGQVWIDGNKLDPGPSLEVFNHSPSGFAWGYEGSGPAQLALAILLYMGLPKQVALDHHQELKRRLVSRWPFGQDFKENYTENYLMGLIQVYA